MNKQALSRPALRYQGSKWRIAPWVISFFPKHRLYVEPFGGSAGVLLRKHPSKDEIYNDANGELVNFFRVLRDKEQASGLIRLVSLTPYSREEYERAHEPTDDPIERARRTAIKSFMSFGGRDLTRTGKSGFALAVKTARHGWANDWKNYPDALAAIIERLQGVTLEHGDAIKMIKRLGNIEDALIYVDPPYVGASGYEFAVDHDELIDTLKACRAYVVLSGYEGGGIDGWEKQTKTAYTAINSTGARTECLWLSPRTSDALFAIME